MKTLMESINRQFGAGSLQVLGDTVAELTPVIPTGSIGLDLALGVGGYPRGRVTEISGAPRSGKTTLAIHAIRETQKTGGIAAIIDVAQRFNVEWARECGVNLEKLLVSQPDTGEQALEIVEALVRSGAVDLVVFDGPIVTKAAIEGDHDHAEGLAARLIGQGLRKLTAIASRTSCTLLFISTQAERDAGTGALKFYASVRILTARGPRLAAGCRIHARVVKNKCAAPFKDAQFDIRAGGIDRIGELVDMAKMEGDRERNRDSLIADPSLHTAIAREVLP